MFVSTRLALVSLLVSVVLVAAAAAADSKSKKLIVAPSPPQQRTRAPPAPAIFKDEKDGAISNGAMARNGIPCDINHQENCEPQRNENEYNRGCNPATRCRTGARRMLLEDQLGVAPNFGELKD